jgi:2-oxoglutarate dehydrogenase E2 component (dihydrolipoamide succinyltransferase)
MKIEIPMPKMGESVMEGTIVKWYKKPGDSVKKDETLFEISTDKVDTEVPSPADGIVTELLFLEGDTVDVGKTVAYLETDSTAASIAKSTPAKVKEEKVVEIAASENIDVQTESVKPAEVSDSLIDIPMPKMGESVMDGTIIKWYKKIGDTVKKDETIFEISTDKVDTEVPSPSEGILVEILVGEQVTVEVGTICGRLSVHGAAHAAPKIESEKIPEYKDDSMHSMIAKSVDEASEVRSNESSKFYSPLVLNIARAEKVGFDELENISGTGTGGRVTKNDILNYVSKRNKGEVLQPKIEITQDSIKNVTKPTVVYSAPKKDFDNSYVSGGVERIPMDNIRQRIMQHMINSRDTSVHVTALMEVDMTRIHNYIQKNKDSFAKKEGIKLTYMSFVAHASVKALKEFPIVNSTVEGTTILQKRFINLGIAVALEPNGLIVPNIKNAQDKNLLGIARGIVDVAERSRTKKLTPDDISGGTFTITNYGVFGTLFGTPIINQPEVAILGVGAVVKKPVVVEVDGMDTIAIKPIMYLTLAHDHRLIDGMVGGKFLKSIKDTLEQFDDKVFG